MHKSGYLLSRSHHDDTDFLIANSGWLMLITSHTDLVCQCRRNTVRNNDVNRSRLARRERKRVCGWPAATSWGGIHCRLGDAMADLLLFSAVTKAWWANWFCLKSQVTAGVWPNQCNHFVLAQVRNHPCPAYAHFKLDFCVISQCLFY